MAPTKFLDFVAETAAREASAKYADEGNSNFWRYLFSSNQLPQGANIGHHVAEGLRYQAFGDPLTLYNEYKNQGWRHAMNQTFLPRTPNGKVHMPSAVMNLGVPAALAAWQIGSIPAEQRHQYRGTLAGGAAGALVGGLAGSRFGLLGQFALAPAAQHFGAWLGSRFDAKPEQPAHYQVNLPPGRVRSPNAQPASPNTLPPAT